MFSTVLLATLVGSAFAAPIAQRDQPSDWASGYLEDYATYHARYIALNCHDKHDTTFFTDCCKPMLATENLTDNRKAYCVPSSTDSASAAAYTATATVTDSADAEAATGFSNATSSVESVYESVAATATAEVTSITLSTSSIAEATSTASVIGDNAWAKNKNSKTSTTSTSTAQQWTATSTSTTQEWTATSTSTTAAAATTSSTSSDTKTGGHATYFYQGGNAGACGTVHSDSDYIIAIDSNGYWADYSSGGSSQYCGKYINIKNTNNGNTVKAMVADVCPTCDNNNSLDLSVGAFSVLAGGDMGLGLLPIEWSFA